MVDLNLLIFMYILFVFIVFIFLQLYIIIIILMIIIIFIIRWYIFSCNGWIIFIIGEVHWIILPDIVLIKDIEITGE